MLKTSILKTLNKRRGSRMTVRSRIATLVAEFLGTAVLATVAINVSRSQIGIGYFVAIGVGVALALLVLMFGRVSGAHLNPAVTIGLWTLRKIGTVQAIAYLAVQMLGGLAAWQLANYFVGQEIQSIAGNAFDWKVLVAEAVGALVFTFAIAAAVFKDELDSTQKAALIGGGLFLGVVTASLASNAVLNPAIALANQSWSRAYIFGPIIGSVIGMNLYVLLFAPASALVPSRARATVTTTSSAPAKTRTVAKKAPARRKSVARKRK
jgi:glycerol uptake facilitator-like aquaporin